MTKVVSFPIAPRISLNQRMQDATTSEAIPDWEREMWARCLAAPPSEHAKIIAACVQDACSNK